MIAGTRPVCLHDKGVIETSLRQDVYLSIYGLGDLDDRFWPHTTWYALEEAGRIKALTLMYSGLTLPTLLALGDEGQLPALQELIRSMIRLLPIRFYAHLSLPLADVLEEQYRLESHGVHRKMGLMDRSHLPAADPPGLVSLLPADLDEVRTFYDVAYPGGWFEPQMLETGQYLGLRGADGLLSVAGVHVCSPRYRVAALGGIATHPAHRGRGLARAVVGALCRRLLATVDHVGLNVKADNEPAARCYRSLGFTATATYLECLAVRT